LITDYRGNINSGIRDTLTVDVGSTTDPLSLNDISFTETEINSGVFRVDNPIIFTTSGTVPATTSLAAANGDSITADYDSPAISATNIAGLDTGKTITATIVDINAFDPNPTSTEPIQPDKFVYVIGTCTTSLKIIDPLAAGDAFTAEHLISGEATMNSPVHVGGPISIPMTEQANTGEFFSDINLCFVSGDSDPPVGVIKVSTDAGSDTVTFSYTRGATTHPDLDIGIIDTPIDVISQDISGRFNIGFTCAQFGGDDDGDGLCKNWEDHADPQGLRISYLNITQFLETGNPVTSTKTWFEPCGFEPDLDSS